MFIIEVTGISGAGKSYFLSILKNSKYKFMYDTDIIKKYKLTDLKLFFIFLKSSNMFPIFILIVKIAFQLDFKLFNKLNFMRNTIKKVAKNYFYNSLHKDKILIVDEGLSHLYQNIIDENKINYNTVFLIKKLNKLLDQTCHIVVVDASNSVILLRLSQRGHKRIQDKNLLSKFINNGRIMMKEVLKDKNYKVVYVKNESLIDLEQFIDEIEGIS